MYSYIFQEEQQKNEHKQLQEKAAPALCYGNATRFKGLSALVRFSNFHTDVYTLRSIPLIFRDRQKQTPSIKQHCICTFMNTDW